MKEPYDWDAYAEEFFPGAERLVNAATIAAAAGEEEKAAEFFLYELDPSANMCTSLMPTPGEPLRCTELLASLRPGHRSSGWPGRKVKKHFSRVKISSRIPYDKSRSHTCMALPMKEG